MDIIELGAIGELVGGLAVIATLIYLAVQLGQTKEMMRMESARSTTKDFSAFMHELMDADHMELFRRGFEHFESMEPNDQARLHGVVGDTGKREGGVSRIRRTIGWGSQAELRRVVEDLEDQRFVVNSRVC